MNGFLPFCVLILGLVVVFGLFNERITKLTYEIALLLFSVFAGFILLLILSIIRGSSIGELLATGQVFNIEKFLMEGVLCLMLFAGSCHNSLYRFKEQARAISVLALGGTFCGALIYGLLFFALSSLTSLGLSLPVCLLFGSIVAPTDPIAATGILRKFGLPEKTGFLIESESLLNDGVGVALFVCFSALVKGEHGSGFFKVMGKELLGAILIGLIFGALCWWLSVLTKDEIRRILISIFCVTSAYLLCEKTDCSGAIASVVCGVIFSTLRDQAKQKSSAAENNTQSTDVSMMLFDSFWEIMDTLLNSILYVMLGLTFVRILQMHHMVLIVVSAVCFNLIARGLSVYGACYLIGPIPDGFDKKEFTSLLTWGGLRGGLSIALAMSAAALLTIDSYHMILGGTYAIVFFTTVIQGLTVKKLYDMIIKS